MMKEEQTVWGGEPGQSNFYTTNEVAESIGTDATKLYQGLQVSKGDYQQYREFFTQWKFNQDTLVGFSQAKLNSNFGVGGFDQYYVPNFTDVLEKIGSISMTNR